MEKSFELSSRVYKNGRRKFKAVLYKLQPPESVIDGVGTQYNKNGISFLEKHCEKQLESIKDMSVTVCFLDDERTQIYDHGFTEMNTQDGLPTFDNATTIGHFNRGYIDDVIIDNEKVRAVLGEGYLDEMRYHSFIEKLSGELSKGSSVEGSIEIFRDENHDTIVYENGYREQGRIPLFFMHSGWAMVMNPADTNSQLIELNNRNKEEDPKMDEAKIMEIVQKAIMEMNSSKADTETKIAELNALIEAKDAEIKELNAEKEATKADADEKDKKIKDLEEDKDNLSKEVNECKKKELNSELDAKLERYSEEEKKYAESEINSYKANPLEGDADSIILKVKAGIGERAKAAEEAKVTELNSVNSKETIDIFSEVNSADEEDEEATNIF